MIIFSSVTAAMREGFKVFDYSSSESMWIVRREIRRGIWALALALTRSTDVG